jgi:hypothetical protein
MPAFWRRSLMNPRDGQPHREVSSPAQYRHGRCPEYGRRLARALRRSDRAPLLMHPPVQIGGANSGMDDQNATDLADTSRGYDQERTMQKLRAALCALVCVWAPGAHAATAGMSYVIESYGFAPLNATATLADLDLTDGIVPSLTGFEGMGDTGCFCFAVDGAFEYLTDKPPGYYGVRTTDIGVIESGGYGEHMAFWLTPRSAVTLSVKAKVFVSTGDYGQEAGAAIGLALEAVEPPFWFFPVLASDSLSVSIPMGSGPSFLEQAKTVQVSFENDTAESVHLALSDYQYLWARTVQTPGDGAIDALPVPEPGSWEMLLLGLLAVGHAYRRRAQ